MKTLKLIGKVLLTVIVCGGMLGTIVTMFDIPNVLDSIWGDHYDDPVH